MSNLTAIRDNLLRNGYTLEGLIGSGNYAEVYRAVKITDARRVAVKVIDLVSVPIFYLVRFLPLGIAILQHMKHPNIIEIYEITQTSLKVYMIMELAENGSIGDWIRDNGAITEITARQMFAKIVQALAYLHSYRIAHRDLRVEKILLTDPLNPKLSGFSYAKLVDENNVWSQTFCGSLPYFPPEILQNHNYNPLISDIWSLGICLYVMLNNALPYTIKDDRKMLRMQLNKEWTFHRRVEHQLSQQVKNCVKSMLEPDVNMRPNIQALLNDPWISGP